MVLLNFSGSTDIALRIVIHKLQDDAVCIWYLFGTFGRILKIFRAQTILRIEMIIYDSEELA